MLHAANDLKGLHLEGADGRVGTVDDLYFDDEDWTIRYLVVSTGSWLSGRSVLISPHSLGKPDMAKKAIPSRLSLDRIKSAPGVETDKPVSRQFEMNYNDYFGYPYYWRGPFIWGGTAFPYFAPAVGMLDQPAAAPDQGRRTGRERDAGEGGDPHLRSAAEVSGYKVEAADGGIGHIEDFLMDAGDWSIRYLAIDTRSWLPGKHVAVPVDWAKDISWEDRKVVFGHLKEEIRKAPEYSGIGYVTPEYSRALDSYYQGSESRA